MAGANYAGERKPVIINPDSGQIANLFPNETIGNLNYSGRSFFNPESGEHIDIITSPTYFGLFKYNINTQQSNIKKLTFPNDLSSLVAILDVRKVEWQLEISIETEI